MKKNFLYFIFIVLAQNTYAQNPIKLHTDSKKAIKNYESAQANYDVRRYDMTIEDLKRALEADEHFLEAWQLLGYTYQDKDNQKEAINCFLKVIALDKTYFPTTLFTLAVIEYQSAMYSEALIHIEDFLSTKKARPDIIKVAEKIKTYAVFSKNAIANPVPFNPQNLGAGINTKNKEYLPIVSADELYLIFSRTVPIDSTKTYNLANSSEDFYWSTIQNEKWSNAKNLGEPINTDMNEGAHSLSPDGQLFVFTGCESKVYGYGETRKGYGSCDLFYSIKRGTRWSDPKNMGNILNSNKWDSQPSLSADGKTIYFISNRPGGKGGMDIWKSELDEFKGWSKPINLGDSINTTEDEMSPYIHPDGKTLYFASNGHIGLGSFDLYMTKIRDDASYTTPINFGYPINTNGSEFGLSVSASGSKAFYASEREGGFGDWDIYSFDLPNKVRAQSVTYVKGKVFDAKTNAPLGSKFELIDLETSKTVVSSYSNEENGEFLVCLPANGNYALNASKTGYLFYSENFSLKGKSVNAPYAMNVDLNPAKSGEKVVLKNIFFETAKFDLKQESNVELNKLIQFLNLNPNLNVEIAGHTDNVGDKKSNQLLSENRAKAVYDYLIKSNISATRLSYKGYGDTQPMDDNKTDMGKANNRRTEFKIL